MAGCTTQAPPPGPQGPPIRIGAPISLTGSQSQAGQLVQEGYQFCQDWINAKGGIYIKGTWHQMDIITEDDASRLSLSGSLTERMITQGGMRLLLGPSTDAATAHDAPITDAHGVPMVAPAGVSDPIFNSGYHNIFSVLTPASQTMRGVIDMALAHWAAPHSLAILSANDTLSTELAGGARNYAASVGLNVVDFDQFPAGTNNMDAQLQAAAGTNPDLLIVAAPSGDGVTALATARAMNIGAQLLGFTDGPQSDAFVTALHTTANDAIGAAQWAPTVRSPVEYFLSGADYTSQYLTRFGHAPDWHSAAATAACLALEVAIQRAGSADPQKVRASLSALNLQTFFGPIAFDALGANMAKPMYVVQVLKGHSVVVWPADNANAEPLYPWPGWSK